MANKDNNSDTDFVNVIQQHKNNSSSLSFLHQQNMDSSPSFYTQHLDRRSVLICKRNKVNWAKNDRVRAVFVAEVKIPENEQF